jgi:hypothetical protein
MSRFFVCTYSTDVLAAALPAGLDDAAGSLLTSALADGLGWAASYWPEITAQTSAATSTAATADPNRKILNISRASSSYA